MVTDQGNSDNVLVFLNTTSIGASIPSFSKINAAQMAFGLNSVSIGDLNGDGKLDIAIIDFTTLSILLNTTTIGDSISSFSLLPSTNIGGSIDQVVIGDLNGDGKPDLTITDQFHSEVQILLNFTTA